mmetsp:Transcript_20802/g.52424  ORF Transcript_20802/g.52424 Transcript_20802/m.52424 type:complete len:791 (-) Transcript_20802:307-2679(-)
MSERKEAAGAESYEFFNKNTCCAQETAPARDRDGLRLPPTPGIAPKQIPEENVGTMSHDGRIGRRARTSIRCKKLQVTANGSRKCYEATVRRSRCRIRQLEAMEDTRFLCFSRPPETTARKNSVDSSCGFFRCRSRPARRSRLLACVLACHLACPSLVDAAIARMWRFVCTNPGGAIGWRYCNFNMYTDAACNQAIYDTLSPTNALTEVDFNGNTGQDPTESASTTIRGPYTAADSYLGVTLSSALEIQCVRLNTNICFDLAAGGNVVPECTSGYELRYAEGGEWKVAGAFSSDAHKTGSGPFVVGAAGVVITTTTPTPKPAGKASPAPSPGPVAGPPTFTIVSPNHNAINIATTNVAVRVDWSEQVQASYSGATARLYLGGVSSTTVVQSANIQSSLAQWNGVWQTRFTLPGPLNPDTQYRFEISSGDIADMSGTYPANDVVIAFTTGAAGTTGAGGAGGSGAATPAPGVAPGAAASAGGDSDDDSSGVIIGVLVTLGVLLFAGVGGRYLYLQRRRQKQSQSAQQQYGKVVTPEGVFQQQDSNLEEKRSRDNKTNGTSGKAANYRAAKTTDTIPPTKTQEQFEELRQRKEREFEERRAQEYARRAAEQEERRKGRSQDDMGDVGGGGKPGSRGNKRADAADPGANSSYNKRRQSSEEPPSSSRGGGAGGGAGAKGGSADPKFNANAWNARGARKTFGRKRSNSETIDPDTEFLAESNEGHEVLTITTSIAQDLRKQKTETLESKKKTMKFLKLKWHPDKNSEQPELAKKIFQFIMEQEDKFLALANEGK